MKQPITVITCTKSACPTMVFLSMLAHVRSIEPLESGAIHGQMLAWQKLTLNHTLMETTLTQTGRCTDKTTYVEPRDYTQNNFLRMDCMEIVFSAS